MWKILLTLFGLTGLSWVIFILVTSRHPTGTEPFLLGMICGGLNYVIWRELT